MCFCGVCVFTSIILYTHLFIQCGSIISNFFYMTFPPLLLYLFYNNPTLMLQLENVVECYSEPFTGFNPIPEA